MDRSTFHTISSLESCCAGCLRAFGAEVMCGGERLCRSSQRNSGVLSAV
jgi:hypothetical protein